MVVMKYNTAYSEQFITPVRGLYLDYVISVEDFKEQNAGIMKNRWIDTGHGDKGEKIYELFDPELDGEIVKESMQEWLCDNRHEITQCISIALQNHEMSYAEWFKFVDDKSGPDELALYSLFRKHGIHTSVFNKSYVWTTLMNHVNRSDKEIFSFSGVNLVYLGRTTYRIIRDIHTPQPQKEPNPTTSRPPGQKHQTCASKVTCRDSSRGRKTNTERSTGHGRGNRGKKSQTLSESRQANYGISVSNITPCTVRRSRQPIDYVSLNDGYNDETLDFPKCRRKESYRPRSAPSATRLSAHKRMSSPESIAVNGDTPTDKFSAVLSTSADGGTLPGIPNAEELLPDLVVNQTQSDPVPPPQPENVQENLLPANAANMEEELEAASTLLSLSDTLEDTLEE